MAGYSGKPLGTKLGLKPGHRVCLIGAPDSLLDDLEPIPEGVQMVDIDEDEIDIVLLFTAEAANLSNMFSATMDRLTTAGMIWICWPKKAAKALTDLDENKVRDIGLAAGMVDVKVCAIDHYWSGLKFVRRLRDR